MQLRIGKIVLHVKAMLGGGEIQDDEVTRKKLRSSRAKFDLFLTV
jgi:hypothetical protein